MIDMYAPRIIEQVNEAVSRWNTLAAQYDIPREVVDLIERTRNYV